MKALIVGVVLVAMLTLFFAATAEPDHQAETQVVAVEAECPCAIDGCTHSALANVPHYGTEARIESHVLKLPIEIIGNESMVDNSLSVSTVFGIMPGTRLKLPNYSRHRLNDDSEATDRKVEVVNVGVLV